MVDMADFTSSGDWQPAMLSSLIQIRDHTRYHEDALATGRYLLSVVVLINMGPHFVP